MVVLLNNMKSVYNKKIEKITCKIVVNFIYDEYGGKLWTILKDIREHVTYTIEDVAEHVKLLVSLELSSVHMSIYLTRSAYCYI